MSKEAKKIGLVNMIIDIADLFWWLWSVAVISTRSWIVIDLYIHPLDFGLFILVDNLASVEKVIGLVQRIPFSFYTLNQLRVCMLSLTILPAMLASSALIVVG